MKVYYSHLGTDTFAAEYCDYGARPARFGKNPQIEINLDLSHGLGIAEAIAHELFHLFTRLLPERLELFLDCCIDVTEGQHCKIEVWKLGDILKGKYST